MGLIKRAFEVDISDALTDGLIESEGGKFTGGKLMHLGYLGGGVAAHRALMKRYRQKVMDELNKSLYKLRVL